MHTEKTKYWNYRTTLQESKRACADVERQARRWHIDENTVLKINLVTEELFQNTISHAVPQKDDGHVETFMSLEGTSLILNYREEAPFFDPLKHEYTDTEETTVGGRGILLILGMSINAFFSREEGWNCLRLEFEL